MYEQKDKFTRRDECIHQMYMYRLKKCTDIYFEPVFKDFKSLLYTLINFRNCVKVRENKSAYSLSETCPQ